MVTWTVEPHAIPGWIREPNIGFSQVGYLPDQSKVAVIELDKNDNMQPTASLIRLDDNGTTHMAFSGEVKMWGAYFKYNYAKFDFTSVKEPGVYYIEYGKTRTNDFIIDTHIYDQITDATTDVWVPIHMNRSLLRCLCVVPGIVEEVMHFRLHLREPLAAQGDELLGLRQQRDELIHVGITRRQLCRYGFQPCYSFLIGHTFNNVY